MLRLLKSDKEKCIWDTVLYIILIYLSFPFSIAKSCFYLCAELFLNLMDFLQVLYFPYLVAYLNAEQLINKIWFLSNLVKQKKQRKEGFQ